MASVKKLVRHGNSSALIIEKPILDLLSIGQETPLEITTDGERLIITPLDPKVSASLKKVNKKHGKTLKRLAK